MFDEVYLRDFVMEDYETIHEVYNPVTDMKYSLDQDSLDTRLMLLSESTPYHEDQEAVEYHKKSARLWDSADPDKSYKAHVTNLIKSFAESVVARARKERSMSWPLSGFRFEDYPEVFRYVHKHYSVKTLLYESLYNLGARMEYEYLQSFIEPGTFYIRLDDWRPQ